MSNKIVSVVIILVLLVGGFFLFKQKSSAPIDMVPVEETAETDNTENSDVVYQEFEIKGTNYEYSLTEIEVKKGETVRITLVSEQGMHDLKIDELGVATKILQTGETETVEFVADKVGTFEYYCSVGNHRAQGMVGKIIVTE